MRAVARSGSGRLPVTAQPVVQPRHGHEKAPVQRNAARGLRNEARPRPRQAVRSGAGATTRVVRVGLKLADHIIAGRSNIR